MAKTEVLQFSKARKRVPVIMTDEDGTPHEYSLREFNDETRDGYLEEMRERGIGKSKDGKPDLDKVKSLAGMQRSLVGLCFYDDKDELVSEEVLSKELGATVITALFFKCLELNSLDKDALDKAKNA